MVKGGLDTGDRPKAKERQSPRIARNELITSRYWSTAFLSPREPQFPRFHALAGAGQRETGSIR